MRLLALFSLLIVAIIRAEDAPLSSAGFPASDNINSRYRIESVQFPENLSKKISRSVRQQADQLVGQHFDPTAVTDLANRIRRDLHIVVTHRLEKGEQPEYVRLVFEGKPRRWDEDDARVTKLDYHQKQGWTGGVEVGTEVGRNRFEFGLQSDADSLLERFAGLNAGYSRPIGSDRVRVRFEFQALHQEWNPATELALSEQSEIPGIYRERFSMEPSVVILLAPGLSLAAGLDFQHFQTQFPAARFEAANAVMTTLRHRRRWQSSGSTAGHELDAGYSLRAATNLLDSDYVYTRHSVDGRYSHKQGHHTLMLRGNAGTVTGRAPLFERFALGDTHTLRGWNKFDIDPLGGSRMVHGSIQYRYRCAGVFYDTGAVWDRTEDADTRHAAGVILAVSRGGPYVTVGFPLRAGGIYPLFMMGMNF